MIVTRVRRPRGRPAETYQVEVCDRCGSRIELYARVVDGRRYVLCKACRGALAGRAGVRE